MTGQKNRFKTTEKLWDLNDKQLKTPKHDAMVLWLMDKKNSEELIINTFYSKNLPNMEWVVSDENYEERERLYDFFKADCEVPLYSSPTFIGGYADIVFSVGLKFIESKHKSPYSKKMLDEAKEVNNIEEMLLLINKYSKREITKFEPASHSRFYDGNGNYYCPVSSEIKDFENVKIIDFISNKEWGVPADDDLKRSEIVDWAYGNKTLYLITQVGRSSPYSGGIYPLTCLVEVKPYIDSFGAVLRQIQSYKSFTDVNCYALFTLDSRFDSQFESQGIKVLHPPEDVKIEDMIEMYL